MREAIAYISDRRIVHGIETFCIIYCLIKSAVLMNEIGC